MVKTNIDDIKLGGARRKNGHKLTCTCHICENMKNKAKRGGYKEEVEMEQEKMMGGSKKKNGHRKNCKCPICKNMAHSKKHKGGKRRTRKHKGGDDTDGYEEAKNEVNDDEVDNSDTDTDNNDNDDDTGSDTDSSSYSDSDTDSDTDDDDDDKNMMGGKKRKRKGNGHKKNCQCPICRNMRKSKKGGDGVELNITKNEIKASDADYDSLEKSVGGGTRKYKKKHRRRNTRKHYRKRK